MNQSDRPWIFIMTHGKFGQELKKSAEMILGTMKDVYCFSLMEEMCPQDLDEMIYSKLQEAPEGTIILTDLFGGTPANVAARYAKKFLVITGVNLPMLIEIEMMRSQGNQDGWNEKIISSAKEGIQNISQWIKEKEAENRERHQVSKN